MFILKSYEIDLKHTKNPDENPHLPMDFRNLDEKNLQTKS
jgi:hypothetical protein